MDQKSGVLLVHPLRTQVRPPQSQSQSSDTLRSSLSLSHSGHSGLALTGGHHPESHAEEHHAGGCLLNEYDNKRLTCTTNLSLGQI